MKDENKKIENEENVTDSVTEETENNSSTQETIENIAEKIVKNEKGEDVKVIVEYKNPKKDKLKRFISVVLVFMLCFIAYFSGVLSERMTTDNINNLKLKKIQRLIDDNYYFTSLIDHNKAFENSLDTYVASFGDQFTYYLNEDYLKSFNEAMTGEYEGIGVSVTTDDSGYVVVTESYEGGPAFESGIIPGDKIIEVNGENVIGIDLDTVVSKIRGPKDKTVKVTILKSDNSKKEYSLTRKELVVKTVNSRMLDSNIGYIKISSFDTSTDEEFEEKLTKLKSQDLKGLVIDLRNNGGGILDTVVNISDLLMPEGTIVSIKYRNEKDKVYKSDDKCIDVPISVLINENTASASELLAGGLKCNNNAVLVGEKSFGKGVVGSQFNIDSNTAMVITVGEYFLPDGKNIHKKGIEPDVNVKLGDDVTNIYLMEDSDDIQLQKAVEEIKKRWK